MNENDIKVEVLAWIRRACRGRALPVVTSEFSLNGTGIRADLAVLGDDFCGIEIKSDYDTLKRLPSQMEGYARYFDQTMLVVADRHVKSLESVDIKHASAWVFEGRGKYRQIIEGSKCQVEGHTLLGLLTAIEERRAIIEIESGEECSTSQSVDCFRTAFAAAFRRRYQRTSDEFWRSVKGRAITPNDLKMLSRFYPDRIRAEELSKRSDEKWSNWIGQINSLHA